MKRIVWTFGIIGGLITGGMFFILHSDGEINFEGGELTGYITMIVALSTIFFAVKQYRDKHLAGDIPFGKSFLIGLYVTLIASALYVLSWEAYFQTLGGDFVDQYLEYFKSDLAKQGKSEIQIQEEITDTESMMRLYKDNLFVRMGFTFMEIFPVGLLISLLTAAT